MKNLIMALVVLAVPALAQADIANGRFETGDFSGWQTIGDALVVDTSVGSKSPGRGTYQALITNAPGGGGSEHPESYSGNNSVDAFSSILGGPPSTVELFLGLGNGSLEQFSLSLGGPFSDLAVTVGSAIKQTFTANAGSILILIGNI